jgi:hypothetical protein
MHTHGGFHACTHIKSYHAAIYVMLVTCTCTQTAFLEKEIAKKQVQVTKIKAHMVDCKTERDAMEKALKESVETMQETVKYCSKMTQKTNSNIARLTRTMAPKSHDNFLTTGVKEKDELMLS